MNERASAPTQDTKNLQRAAGDPFSSAWISANAGSGKTYILTERVLRILLTGVPCAEILCLTYTKAAAAEMKSRVAERLAKWAIASEADLREELHEVTGNLPTDDLLQRARGLFAFALETPGGLKINTIHAFCESVLQRFPLEAGVPVGFTVIEEVEQGDMIRHAIDQVLAGGLGGQADVAEAVATLFAVMSDHQIDKAIHAALAQPRLLRDVLADPQSAHKNLMNLLGTTGGLTRAEVEHEVLAGGQFGRAEAEAVYEITPPEADGKRFEDKLARLKWDRLSPEDLFGAFLTQAGAPSKRGFPKAPIIKANPGLADALLAEAERLAELFEQLKIADILASSSALLAVLSAVNAHYQRAKSLANRLDFDDLIARLVQLLDVKQAREWVRYKLDSGITHILVDESQDTNPDQWRVVEQLSEEFFVGAGAVDRPRSVFAVGDEKQSIYSFQGADPTLFARTGDEIQRRAKAADMKFVRRGFRASFRTLENILNAVDAVAQDPEVAAGLMLPEDDRGHESARLCKGGTVTLWPPVEPEETPPADDEWPVEPAPHQKSPPNQLAERIATQIAGWISSKRPLEQRGRPVTADDVLVLVQTRGPLFSALIGELKARNIPTPGADRVSVTGHVIADDLMALADVLNDPTDDLTLAALLRSPLFALDESQIYTLSFDRKAAFLWDRLKASSDPDCRRAFSQLDAWRNRLDFERPYEFFAQVLYADGALARFRQRLTAEIDDVLAEFLELALAHEQTPQPSLIGFVAEMRARDLAIKRELAETGNGVRVMTVHGAKGLEAPIVILADATLSRTSTGPVYLRGQPNPALVYVANKQSHTEATLAALRQPDEDMQKAEDWRKLYVGMTRAEDELYVTGFLNKKSKVEGSWYDKIEQALKPHAIEVDIAGEPELAGWRYPQILPPPVKKQQIQTAPSAELDKAPDLTPPPPAQPVETLSPSRAGGDEIFANIPPRPAAALSLDEDLVASDPDLAKRRGTALHALLQHLEKVPEEKRADVALASLDVLLPQAPRLHAELAEKALSIYGSEHAALLFGANSRAELPFLLSAKRKGKPVHINGYIDRMIVTGSDVLIVDFKSDLQPATKPEEVGTAYRTQLGLYTLAGKKLFPGKLIRAALFWTTTETLMELPPNLLETAIADFTLE